ncbi:S24 family peptidase [Solibacillus sp. FSL K6-1523]|uniref:S24 family peptidase n=1 Tax=Solibacillus sp. FSL K6-1523 TaxID=2921471 RepID=UPI0030FC2CE6
MNGESMNKVIHHGSLVIAMPLALVQYKDGDLVIFSYNNEYSLKRFAPNELDGYLLFKSESTDSSFKDIPFAMVVMEELKIYGKVVYYGNTL